MKKVLLISSLLLILCANIAMAGPGSFLTRWVTNNGTIIIPVTNSGVAYSYNVTWTNLTNAGVGNGSVSGHVGNYIITGLTNGNTYQIEISGNFPGFYFSNGTEKDKIRMIERWGSSLWTSMANAFYGCQFLTCSATDFPDVSQVTNTSYAFAGARLFNADLSGWDVSNVTTMRYMFYVASTFNGNISPWNVSKVTDMTRMFWSAEAFNQNLNSWDVSKVTNMSYMFEDAEAFNGVVSSWNVSSATNMSHMFSQATVFNQAVNGWNVSNVTDMSAMFHFASAFNRNLNNWNVGKVTNMRAMFDKARAFNGNINNWDVSKVTDMSLMFSQADDFNQDISGWNVSNVTDMSFVFDRATLFNQNLNNWDVSKVTNLINAFAGAESFNQSLNNWNVGNVTQMGGTFRGATVFNGDISTWNVSKVTTMNGMFGSTAFNGDLSNWNVANVTDMTGMFAYTNAFNQNISSWNVSKVTQMQYMFSSAKVFNQPLSTWNVGNVTNMLEMFMQAEAFNQDLNTWNTSKVTNMARMFYLATAFNRNLNSWDVSKVTDMHEMFKEANAFNGNITTWNVSNVTDMSSMFQHGYAFNGNIGNWNVSKVTDMRAMFAETLAFNQNLNGWDVSKVTRMDFMFVDAGAFNQPLNNWNVSTVTRMDNMFKDTPIFNQELNAWNVGNVTRMDNMFNNASVFNRDLSNWNMSKVTRTDLMFNNAPVFNQDLSTWNVSKVTNMSNMFTNAIAFNQNLDKWNISSVTTMNAMLNGTAISISHYEATLHGWATLDAGETKIPTGVALGAGGLFYTTTGQIPRTSLVTTRTWTITGDALVGGAGIPTITSFTPTSAITGAIVTVTGTNFSTTPGNNTVTFNSTVAIVTASTATSIKTTVPVGATTGKITVTVGGNTATSAANFTVLCGLTPTITSFSPASGVIGTTVVITGTNFSTTPANNIVDFNEAITTVTGSSTTSITTTVPIDAFGTGPISVTVGCNTVTSTGDFTVICPPNPTITSFSPTTGYIGDVVTITGTDFNTNPDYNFVDFNGTLAIVMASSATSITAKVPDGASTGLITISTGCSSVTTTTNFIVDCGPIPTITSFSPSSGTVGSLVTITGTNFSTTPANNLVDFNGISANVTASTATSITVEVPVGTTTGPVSIGIDCNYITSAVDFDIISEVITIISQPSNAIACEGTIATFSTTTTGPGNITYQWQYSPDEIVAFTNVVDGAVYSNAATSTLSVNTSGNLGKGRYRCRISSDLAPSVITGEKELTINATPPAPSVSSTFRCGNGSVTLNATGGSAGQYRWYTVLSGGIAIDGEFYSTYTTPILSATATYYATTVSGNCESSRTPVTATIVTPPSPPIAVGASACPRSTVTLTASGGVNGQYKWYNNETDGTAIGGEVNGSYKTPELMETASYFVSVTDNGCESLRTSVTATIITSGCAPQLTIAPLTTEPGGQITIDLIPLITTVGVLDLNSIKVKVLPLSGAWANIENGMLTIDYTGTLFSGTEFITIEACNTNGVCSQQNYSIEVVGEIMVYNAVTPNGDDKNSIFRLNFIDLLPETKTNEVFIYNRWGIEVFSISDYDNKTRVFAGLTNDGNRLPAGVYFYKIMLPLQDKTLTGFLDLRY